jgi:HEAT repeat protein
MKSPISLLTVGVLVAASCLAQTQKEAPKPASKEQIRVTIKEVLDASFQRAVRRNPDGTADSINYVLLYLNDEDLKRVRDFGTPAISVLREYVPDKESWRQLMVLRLLTEFPSEDALTALVQFAEHSRVRDSAVSHMGKYPIEKTRPFLKKFLNDPDPLVRDAAKRTLAANGET